METLLRGGKNIFAPQLISYDNKIAAGGLISSRNLPFPFNDHHPHLIHPSLDRPHSYSQTASRFNQPFCHSTLSGQTDRLG